MKKILLIILCFMLSGCYNYIELDQLAIVSLIAVDYKENEYKLTIEIRENKKNEENASLIYKSKGYSLDSAIQNLSLTLNKTLYLIDIDTFIFTSDAINNKLDSIIDYLVRENNISTNFNILINDNVDETIELLKDKDKIVGKYINDLFETKNNNVVNIKMQKLSQTYLSEFYDIILPIGTTENDEFTINQAAIFNGEKIANIINFDDVQSYNILKNNTNLSLFKINYNEEFLIFKVLSIKSKMDYDNNSINITLKINGIFDEMEKVDLNNEKIVQELKKLVENKINTNVTSLINSLQTFESDIFGFKKIIYNKTRIKPENIKDLKINVKTKIELDRKGFIFDSIGEYYEQNN